LEIADLAAAFDEAVVRVVELDGPPAAAETRVIVVFDFAATTVENHACLMIELLASFDELKNRRDPLLLATGSTFGKWIYDAEVQPRRHVGLVRVGVGEDRAALERDCRSAGKGSTAPPEKLGFLNSGGAVLKAISESYLGRGPVRVFWLGDRYLWFDWRLLSATAHSTNGWNPAESFLDHLSEAGVSVFPVLLQRPGRRGFARGHVNEARYLAEYTGGRMLRATGAPGEALREQLRWSDEASVVRLAIPVTGRRWTGGGRALKVWTEKPKRTLLLERPFLLEQRPEPAGPPQAGPLSVEALRLVAPSSELRLSEDAKHLCLTLPASIESSPSSNLYVMIEHFRDSETSLRQRFQLRRRPSQRSCVEPADAPEGSRMRVVVFEEGSEWTGFTVK
jgi:hypothetical protein